MQFRDAVLVRVVTQVRTPVTRGLRLCLAGVLVVSVCFAHEFLYHDGFLAAVVMVGVVLAEAGTVNLLLGDGHGGPR